MRSTKLYRITEYLKSSAEFYHDPWDLHEQGACEVLREYGIDDDFTAEELGELNAAMYTLAEQNEFSEAAQLAGNEASGFRLDSEAKSKHAPISDASQVDEVPEVNKWNTEQRDANNPSGNSVSAESVPQCGTTTAEESTENRQCTRR